MKEKKKNVAHVKSHHAKYSQLKYMHSHLY